ncbi:unnamed protein product [Caretta caretta]
MTSLGHALSAVTHPFEKWFKNANHSDGKMHWSCGAAALLIPWMENLVYLFSRTSDCILNTNVLRDCLLCSIRVVATFAA